MLGRKTKQNYLGIEKEKPLEAHVLRSQSQEKKKKLKIISHFSVVLLPPYFLFSTFFARAEIPNELTFLMIKLE